jgi:lipoate-protein ligase A
MELFEVSTMHESSYKIPDGKLVKIKLRISQGRILEIRVLGDFFLHPEDTLDKIENALIGLEVEERSIENVIAKTLEKSDATLIGATAADIAKTIMMAYNAR